jgi:LuxR family quorum-sensing system transcriptional regulator CciR
MTTLAAVPSLLAAFQALATVDDLASLLTDAVRQLGFRHYAMVQHLSLVRPERRGFRLHNYPERWVHQFDRERLGLTDPVHRASQRSLTGFCWTEVGGIVSLSARDRQTLAAAREHGLARGFTVPAHIPGELLGA